MNEAARTLPCPECPGILVLRSSRFGPFYGCEHWPRCDATHGAHPDGSPLGVPADKATKAARMRAHAAFDRLWQEALELYELSTTPPESRAAAQRHILRRCRSRTYKWLAAELEIPFEECHIGAFDAGTCAKVEQICRHIAPADIRAWAKARGL